MIAPQPRQVRYRVRHHARLDAETSAKLEELSRAFHRKRAQVLRHVMQWGLTHGKPWSIDPSIPSSPHLVHMLVEPELLQQVQAAAEAHSASLAPWLRHAMRQVTRADFPPSWQAGETSPPSHDSRYYGTRFMMRLDEPTRMRLEDLSSHFHKPVAEVIRQLVRQARIEDFPESWRLAVDERGQSEGRQADRRNPAGITKEDIHGGTARNSSLG